jgi:hypothetical protein
MSERLQNALNHFITYNIKKSVLDDDDWARVKMFIIAYSNTRWIEKFMNSPVYTDERGCEDSKL